MAKKKRTAEDLADSLLLIRNAKKLIEEQDKKVADELLKAMKREGLSHAGTFSKAEKTSLSVATGLEKEAWLWAEQNYSLKVDTGKALKILKRGSSKVPKFFKVAKTVYVTTRAAKAPHGY